jgi:hypothetical protein
VPTSIIPEGTKWEELSRVGKVFGEGVVAAKDGSIYLSDITTTAKPEDSPGGTIFRFDPTTRAVADPRAVGTARQVMRSIMLT